MNRKILFVFFALLVLASHAWIFGYPTVGGTIDSYDNNQLDGSRFYLSETANVSNITVYVTNVQNPYVAQVALYSDNGGTPQNLMVNSSSVSPVSGWNVFQIPRTQLSPGYYWIVYNTNTPNAYKNNLVYDASDYNQLAYSTSGVNFGTWPSTFPNPAFYGAQYSMYANYTVNTVPNVSYVLPTPGSYYEQNQSVNFSAIANDSENYITKMVAQVLFPNSTSLNYSMIPLQSQVGGNPAVSGLTSFTLNGGFGNNYYTVVDLVNPINETTNLTSWQIYAASSGSVALRVFRIDGGNLDYVGGTGYQSVSTGYNNFSTNIQVKTGDLIGFAVSSSFSISANNQANGLKYQSGDIQSSTLQSSWTTDNYQMSESVVGLNGSYVYNNFNQTIQTGIYNVTYFAGNSLNNFNTSKTYFIVYIPIPANLSIWTQEDYNNTSRVGVYLNNNSSFFANYTNNSGVELNGASCTAFFNDSKFFSMVFNSTLGVYTVNRSFGSSGGFSWTATCFQFPYMILLSSENFTVHNPGVLTDQSSYRNCGSVYYQVNTYNSQGQPINTNLNISILNNLNVTMQQLSVTTTNDNYKGYYLLPPNASSGDWWVNAQTCVNVFYPFMVQTYNADPWKLSLTFNPDKIHYSTSDVFTTTIFALNLNGEGITGLTSSNLSVAVDSSIKPFTEIGNGYYQFSVNTSTLSVGEHAVNVSTKTFAVNGVVSKSFYVG